MSKWPRCICCRKVIRTSDPELWVYRTPLGRLYCSYDCMIKDRHGHADRDRKKVKKVNPGFIDRETLAELKVDLNESHTFEEWADIFGLDYYRMWEKYQNTGGCIVNVIDMCLQEDLAEDSKGLKYHDSLK